ncbi:hypothetical protein ABW19_dt0209441 [Dactylella cylindrospora]|nr:hypothetical protein ABW19_dt0209441 [Dactylella cylindrospora]
MSADKFTAWIAYDESGAKGNLVEGQYSPKRWEETDVDIEITHCGMCGSDVHTLSGGWHAPEFPYVVGHEIVGRAVRVGSQVTHVKVGDRVGVGAQSDSCLKPDCEFCSNNNESYCPEFVQTYDGRHKCGDRTQGGYADNTRVPGAFVINLNKYTNLPSEYIAPMLCGGVTMFSPLKRYGAGPGKKVGIIGLGGLGHFGIMWAKALGAEVYAISRNAKKAEDAKKLGADHIITTDDTPDWSKVYGSTLDLIVSTANSPRMPLTEYLSLLKPFSTMVQVGAPDDGGSLPSISGFTLIMANRSLTGTAIGSRSEIYEMLQLANDTGAKSWINPFPLAKVNDAIKAFNNSEARYRIVLVNEKNVD